MKIPIGRESAVQLFENCLAENRLAQSYIINAPAGMGKKIFANCVTEMIVCSDHSACGGCASCKSFAAHAHPDVIEVKRDEDRATLGIDSVRAILGEVYIRPAMSDYKVVIVHEAHLLTAEAQNAMLKVIEEPPRGVVFLLLCDSVSPILQTVKSRSVAVNLRPLSADELRTAVGSDAGDFEIGFCGGNPGKLRNLMSDSDFSALRNETVDLFSKALGGGAANVYDFVNFFDGNKEKREEIFDIALCLARDAVYKKLGIAEYMINKDKIQQIGAFTSKTDTGGCVRILADMLATVRDRGKNGNYTMAVTQMLFECREVIHG